MKSISITRPECKCGGFAIVNGMCADCYKEKLPMFDVYVGNIGHVYSGKIRSEAMRHFNEYKEQSEAGYGRASGETIILTEDGETILEHTGRIDQKAAGNWNPKQ